MRDGEVVGEGFHAAAGAPHAETEALKAAGDRARGSTVYVTLEPCAHHGRTPPCVDALIRTGVSEVVYSLKDPNPRVKGGGHKRLEEAGVRVRAGLASAEAFRANQSFFKWATTGRPLVSAKFAMSLDGKIATASGDSRWISNDSSRRRGHELRNRHDAVLVGSGTVLADDPRLTTRLDGQEVSHPVRVVADSRGRVPVTARVFQPDLPGRAVLATTETAASNRFEALADRGVEVWSLPAGENGRIDLGALLDRIGRQDLLSVLVEGGGTLLGGLFDSDLIDRIHTFVAPMIIGGRGAPVAVGGVGVSRISEALRLHEVWTETVDGDVWIRGEAREIPQTHLAITANARRETECSQALSKS